MPFLALKHITSPLKRPHSHRSCGSILKSCSVFFSKPPKNTHLYTHLCEGKPQRFTTIWYCTGVQQYCSVTDTLAQFYLAFIIVLQMQKMLLKVMQNVGDVIWLLHTPCNLLNAHTPTHWRTHLFPSPFPLMNRHTFTKNVKSWQHACRCTWRNAHAYTSHTHAHKETRTGYCKMWSIAIDLPPLACLGSASCQT